MHSDPGSRTAVRRCPACGFADARLAVERGCGRLEWGVLDWDDPAARLYRKAGAEALNEWSVFRVARPALEELASFSRD